MIIPNQQNLTVHSLIEEYQRDDRINWRMHWQVKRTPQKASGGPSGPTFDRWGIDGFDSFDSFGGGGSDGVTSDEAGL